MRRVEPGMTNENELSAKMRLHRRLRVARTKPLIIATFFLASCFVQTNVHAQKPSTPSRPKTAPAVSGKKLLHDEFGKPATLASLRKKFVGQKVILQAAHSWKPAKKDPSERYVFDFSRDAEARMSARDRDASQTPTAVAIQLRKTDAELKNALGETPNEDALLDADVDVVLQYDDGTLVMRNESLTELVGESEEPWLIPLIVPLVIVADRDRHAEILEANLASVIGRTLYAIHGSPLLPLETTLPQILHFDAKSEEPLEDMPLLQSLTVVAAKYNSQYDFIVWKLRLGDGREVMSVTKYRDEDAGLANPDNSLLGRAASAFLTTIPPSFTPAEISAIRSRKIIRGMSRQALYYSWGFPPKAINSGRGDRELQYYESRTVYLDESGRVSRWLSLAR
jgi:hypothetical protein